MSVTESLLRVFRVDQQIQGLTSRLSAAEKFLEQQSKTLDQINAKKAALNQQLKALQVQAHDHEVDMKAMDERIATLKGQMDTAQTNKEYKALLTDLNTYKADRSEVETKALEIMGKIDELKKQIGELDKQNEDRDKVKKVAADDRSKRESEIAERLGQLKAEREALVKQVPTSAMKVYLENVRAMGDEAMAPVQELDRRNHEYTCGSCQMTVPIEKAAALMKPGFNDIVLCASCRTILFFEKETAEQFGKKTSTPRKKKSSAEQSQEV